MTTHYQHLGNFSDWVTAAQQQQPLYPKAKPGAETQRQIRELLGFSSGPEQALDVRVEQRWVKDGLVGEALSWSVGYGPRTEAWLLKPEGATKPLPGVIALHDHGGFKFYGKEKIADGPDAPSAEVVEFRRGAYGNRAFANALAKEGYVVLIPDTFMWGSRKFPYETMVAWVKQLTALQDAKFNPEKAGAMPREVWKYNIAAGLYEHLLLEKYCTLLGTSMAGMVCYEDRIAVNYLRTRSDVQADRIAAIGLSGGGGRSAMLQATHDAIRAAVVVGMMSSYPALLDHNVVSHTWMFFPPGLARIGDWSDLTACRAPSPLLVQYDTEDTLFTLQGMQEAHQRIIEHYQSVGAPQNYVGQFYPGPHKFDLEMQKAAFAWLESIL